MARSRFLFHSLARRDALQGGCLLFVCLLLCTPNTQAQNPPLSPAQAAVAMELPVSPWGPYARTHIGPCFLANWVQTQQFAFPIVVGQRREEIVLARMPGADSKTLPRPMRVTLERRAMGLSPLQADKDDRNASLLPPPSSLKGGGANRRASIIEADADGLLWRAHLSFAPADFVQSLLPPTDPQAPAPRWTPGEAIVEYLPVNAESVGDGLLIRVTLTNRSEALQTYFVDVLGGMGAVSPTFLSEDLSITGTPDGLILRHARREDMTFGIVGEGGVSPVRFYQVGDAYFSADSSPRIRQADGRILPPENLPLPEEGKKEKGKGKSREEGRGKREKGKEVERPEARVKSPTPEHPTNLTNPMNPMNPTSRWALARADEIKVAPGKSVTVSFCIGLGRTAENALDVAETLLSLADDAQPIGKPRRDGAIALAQRAHEKARFSSGDSAFDRLMAQSLINIPNHNLRRIGVASRQTGAVYQPEAGGLIALGWALYRPDWAAAELNAHFLTRLDPETPVENPQAVPPTNLFALWELTQRTHDRALLDRFYLHARRRYRELLQAGRLGKDEWLFIWPEDAMRPRRMASEGKREKGKGKSKEGIQVVRYSGSQEGHTDQRSTTNEEDESQIFEYLNTRTPEHPITLKPCNPKTLPPVPSYAPDYSAYVIRAARIMRLLAEEANRPPEEWQEFERDAQFATDALNKTLWNAEQKRFLPAPTIPGDPDLIHADTLESLLPLITGLSGTTPEQRTALLATLTDPKTFWSEFGLRSFSKASPQYRPEKPEHGALRFGLNVLLWKALLDSGETATAQKLAENLLRAYRTAQEKSGGCPEALHGETGAACGATDYSGDACALLLLQAAYHIPGTVATGWDMNLPMTREYDAKSDTLRVVFRASEASGKGSILCALGKPNGSYRLTQGQKQTVVTADASGVVSLTAPPDKTVQQWTLAPEK